MHMKRNSLSFYNFIKTEQTAVTNGKEYTLLTSELNEAPPPPHSACPQILTRLWKFWHNNGTYSDPIKILVRPQNIGAPMEVLTHPWQFWRAHKFALHWLSLLVILGSSALVLGATVMRIKWAIFPSDSPYTYKLASLSHEKFKTHYNMNVRYFR